MSSITVSSTKSTDYEAQFRLSLRLNFKDSNQKEWTSEVFNIFCNTVAFKIRVTRMMMNDYDYSMKIFTQMKALNGVRSTCLLTADTNIKRVDILQTDLYTWQLVAEYKDHIYSESVLGVRLRLCDMRLPFKKLYQDEDFTDFELYAENKVESVHVHRNVLAVSSPVLKIKLLGEWKEAKQGYVQLPGVTNTTLQHFKDYIYLNQVPNKLIDYLKLITITSYYKLVDLPKLGGAKEMSEKFKPENAWEWFEYCVQHKNTKLLLLRLRHFRGYDVITKLERHFFGSKNDKHKDTSNNNFKDLYSDMDFTDFKLRVEAENCISFHKNVLAVHSPVLKTLLLGDWKEAKEGYVQLPDVSKVTLQHFKDYLYLKNLPEDLMDCLNLMSIASHYKMPELEREVAIRISQYLKPGNAWKLIELCVHKRAAYLLVAILKNIVDEDKIDIIEEYLSKNKIT